MISAGHRPPTGTVLDEHGMEDLNPANRTR